MPPDEPQWILNILKNVTIPPPPIYVRYCRMCGVKRQSTDQSIFIRPSFCETCQTKYDEYCKYLNTHRTHWAQDQALNEVVYAYSPDTGVKIEYTRLSHGACD